MQDANVGCQWPGVHCSVKIQWAWSALLSKNPVDQASLA